MNTITVKPVLVESKEPTDLIICAVDKWLFKTEHYGSAFSSVLGEDKYQQLVLVSADPKGKINDGDFHIKRHGDRFGNYIDNSPIEWCHKFKYAKVIVTQNQIPEAYIEQFVIEYNKGKVKDIEIEMEWRLGDTEDERYNLVPVYMPKLTDGFVIVIDKEPILYTEEEVFNLCYSAMKERGYTPLTVFNDWFEFNKKK